MQRIEAIAAAKPQGIILREKDLPEEQYTALAQNVLHICREYAVPCTLHSFHEAALRLQAERIHLPLPVLRTMTAAQKSQFSVIGASVHSPEEAQEAEALGASCLSAGHIFATDCKKNLPGRGLDFLAEVCGSVRIPVYAIGGISAENINSVRNAGAAGACIMSGLMQCDNVKKFLKQLEVKP